METSRTYPVVTPDKAPSRPRPEWQRGQTLVVVAVMLVVLIAFLGLVIDGGNVYAQRRQLQNAADAAALAGARCLAAGQGQATAAAVARQYAASNGADHCIPTTEPYTVTATVSKRVPTFFARIVGVPEVPVSAVAAAAYFKPQGYGNLLPLTILNSFWVTGTEYTIWIGDNEGTPLGTSETRGWLNIDGGQSGTDELTCFVCPDCPSAPTWSLDDLPFWVNSSPGLSNAGVQELASCHSSFKKEEMPDDDPRRDVLMPLFDDTCYPGESCWDDSLGNGQMNYRIVGFAMFHITDVKYQGDPKTISGYFLDKYVRDGEDELPSDELGSENGMSVVRLVR